MALQVGQFNKAINWNKAEEEDKLKQQQADASAAKSKQEAGDIGGILGMLALGLGAAAIIGTGGLATPFALGALGSTGAIGAITGAAAAGGTIGKVLGSSAGPAPEKVQPTEKAPVDLWGAMERRAGPTQGGLPQLSDQTKLMAESFKALGGLSPDIRNEYQDVLTKGLAKSYGLDIVRSKGKA